MNDAESLRVVCGFASECGRRPVNEDFAGWIAPTGGGAALYGMTFAVADGVGGHEGGRVAAELAVRGFLDGYYSLPVTLPVERVAARVVSSLNRWMVAQGRQDPRLREMATTLSVLVLRERNAHIIHVGDTRIYRFRDRRMTRLTEDHTRRHPDMRHVLYRAVGIEDGIRCDYGCWNVQAHDRFLLCSDGVYDIVSDADLTSILAQRGEPTHAAKQIVAHALAQGGADNATAIVLDVLSLPPLDQSDLERRSDGLPIGELPRIGESIDRFRIVEALSDGRYTCAYRAVDEDSAQEVVIKFPHPRLRGDAAMRKAFLNEAWLGTQVRGPYLAPAIELPHKRPTRLYAVQPFFAGVTLEHRINVQAPVTLKDGVTILSRLCKAVYGLNRAGIIHRDIKPDNILIQPTGEVKLLDLGVARVRGRRESPSEDIPGTPSYMAPEMFAGERGDERSDVFALGVTAYRFFTRGHYPYGEVEPFSRPRFAKYTPIGAHRPDLPTWLDSVLRKAMHVDPAQRYADAMELLFGLEEGLSKADVIVTRRRPLYERNPLLAWKLIALVLAIAVVVLSAMNLQR